MIKVSLSDTWKTLSVYSKKDKKCKLTNRIVTASEQETQLAIAHFTEGKKGKFSYKCYRDPAIKELLIKEFSDKCAYCETDTSAGASYDTEHFRPKNLIILDNGQKVEPGYYWLGSDWNNLLLSCQYCNRAKTHEFADSDDREVGGKQNFFPLSDETKRIRSHEDNIQEEECYRLLINPSIDDPEKHFTYENKGEIRSNTDEGKASIDVYSLNRGKLPTKRNTELLHFYNYIIDLVEALISYRKGNLEKITTIRRKLRSIAEELSPNAQYLGIKRYWYRQVMDDKSRQILSDFEIDLDDLAY
ncbi:MAG: hypothetical protein ABJL55_19690 [Roseibium sp.]